jgi:hypothetical protein
MRISPRINDSLVSHFIPMHIQRYIYTGAASADGIVVVVAREFLACEI